IAPVVQQGDGAREVAAVRLQHPIVAVAGLGGVQPLSLEHGDHLIGVAFRQAAVKLLLAAGGEQEGCAREGGERSDSHDRLPQDCCRNSCCRPSEVRLAMLEVSWQLNMNSCARTVIMTISPGVMPPALPSAAWARAARSEAWPFTCSRAPIMVFMTPLGSVGAAGADRGVTCSRFWN